jgi:endonuclease III
MATETKEQKKERAAEIMGLLMQKFPEDPKTELHYKTPLDLLVATILSAQCTDRRVNEVTVTLFAKYRTAEDYASADLAEFEEEIRPTGFYKNKAKNIVACAMQLAAKHGGGVPDTMDELLALPGVGRKTANLILGVVFGKPAIIVDTHVLRTTQRLELTTNKDPEKVERDLMGLLPERDWTALSNRLILIGRYTCTAKNPDHAGCILNTVCPSAFKI